ncbi:hypothetical protein [Ornithinimicrobium pekingense]|uniref:Fis family transcriptional regulator n=1 Tax=Ornithinimicrobium pekingense TaxID=384677 RepID=A0ABQ2F6M9_9MICO|nr:hypothetical protein [Ornithinimicrobium pekingense]GGK67298.1 hypothetical protein GCM10011509_14510 [Ornithinimicrobium pekingense]
MRWEDLFVDLEAQQAQLERRDRDLEAAEHTRAERGQIELVHRLLGAEGAVLRLRVRGVGWLEATLRDVGADWLLLDHGGTLEARGREILTPLAAVTAVEGLPRRVGDHGVDGRRLGLRPALRAISRDRAVVRVHDREGDHVTGTIDAVLADHLDLARHPDDAARRASAVRGRVSIPYAALSLVRRL